MDAKIEKITETTNVEAVNSIIKTYFPSRKISGKVNLDKQLINLQEMSYEGEEKGYEFFILDNFGFFFEFETDIQDYETNHGDGDIEWSQREYFLTELAFVQNFDVNDNINFPEGRIEISDEIKTLILKIANEKYYRIEEL